MSPSAKGFGRAARITPVAARRLLHASLAVVPFVALLLAGCSAERPTPSRLAAPTPAPGVALPPGETAPTAGAESTEPMSALATDGPAVEITPSGPVPPADEIVRRALAAEPSYSVVAMSVTFTSDGAQTQSRQWRARDRSRVEYAADSGLFPGKIEVDDGVATWSYLPETDTYMRTAGPTYVYTGTDAVTPEPSVPLSEWLIRPYALAYDGMEIVDGRAAYRLAGPRRGAPEPDVGATVWVDAETLALVRARTVSGAKQGAALVMEYRDFVLDPDVPPDFFTLHVPPGKDVMDLDMSDTTISAREVSLDEARRTAGFHVLAPGTLPAGFTLSRVSLSSTTVAGGADIHNVTLWLAGPGDAMIMANQEPRDSLSANTGMKIDLAARAGRAIRIQGHPGALDTLAGMRTLQWATADAHIRLIASVEDVDEATLVALGEGFR